MARILIMDDEEIVRRSIRVMLEREGHMVFEAIDGNEGMELFKDIKPDLLIIDIFMPEKDGLEIIRDVRKEDKNARILAITGGGSTGDLDFLPQAQAFGAQEILRKPFLQEELMDALNRILS